MASEAPASALCYCSLHPLLASLAYSEDSRRVIPPKTFGCQPFCDRLEGMFFCFPNSPYGALFRAGNINSHEKAFPPETLLGNLGSLNIQKSFKLCVHVCAHMCIHAMACQCRSCFACFVERVITEFCSCFLPTKVKWNEGKALL